MSISFQNTHSHTLREHLAERRKSGFLNVRLSEATSKLGENLDTLKESTGSEFGIFNYLTNIAQAPCFKCSDVEYFPLGEAMFERLISDIKSAKRYVYLEFFIMKYNVVVLMVSTYSRGNK